MGPSKERCIRQVRRRGGLRARRKVLGLGDLSSAALEAKELGLKLTMKLCDMLEELKKKEEVEAGP